MSPPEVIARYSEGKQDCSRERDQMQLVSYSLFFDRLIHEIAHLGT